MAKQRKPGQKTIRRMLDDVEAVTKSRFYEDPEPIASPIEMFLVRDGTQAGEPFSALSTREKVQVLGDYTHWSDYEKRGISFEQMDQVYWNVVQGKPREQWLEGTGLDGRLAAPRPTMEEVLEEVRKHLAAAEATPAPKEPPRTLGEALGGREEAHGDDEALSPAAFKALCREIEHDEALRRHIREHGEPADGRLPSLAEVFTEPQRKPEASPEPSPEKTKNKER